MNLKIIHRSSSIWNIIVFTLLSIFFLFAQDAIIHDKSALNFLYLKAFIINSKFLVGFTLFTIISIFSMRKSSRYLYSLQAACIIGLIIKDLFYDFDKFIILMLFIYILFSYYFYILLSLELKRAFVNPGFSTNELFDPMLKKIKCTLTLKDEQFEGYLSNWDEYSCFMSLKLLQNPTERTGRLVIFYDDHEFSQSAQVATMALGYGVGVKFLAEDNNLFNWNEFNKIINDLGFNVEYLK